MRKIQLLILAALFLLLPAHAFLATFFQKIFIGEFARPVFFIAAWKDFLILIFGIIFAVQIFRGKVPRPRISKTEIAIFIFIFWSVLAGIFWTNHGFIQILWGAKYSLEFLIFFFLVRNFPLEKAEREILPQIFLVGAVIAIFVGGIGQFLPPDFLKNFGYSAPPPFGGNFGEPISWCQKISHTELCRAQSTFSGPNQFAAFLLFALPTLFVFTQNLKNRTAQIIGFLIFAVGVFDLFFTFSRAAWIGAGVAGVFGFFQIFKKEIWFARAAKIFAILNLVLIFSAVFFVRPEILLEGAGTAHGAIFLILHSKLFWGILAIFSAAILTIFIRRKNLAGIFGAAIFNFAFAAIAIFSRFFGTFFWEIILRPSSSRGHWERSADGIKFLFENPFGLGLGDAGPASNRFAPDFLGFIPENWFLQVGLESGFLGLILWILILIFLFCELNAVKNFLKIPLTTGLLGLSVASLFLHTFESAPVALCFFGLCGIALNSAKKVSWWEKLRRKFGVNF